MPARRAIRRSQVCRAGDGRLGVARIFNLLVSSRIAARRDDSLVARLSRPCVSTGVGERKRTGGDARATTLPRQAVSPNCIRQGVEAPKRAAFAKAPQISNPEATNSHISHLARNAGRPERRHVGGLGRSSRKSRLQTGAPPWPVRNTRAKGRIVKLARTICLCALLVAPATAWSRLEVLPDPAVRQVFGGTTQSVSVLWHNAGSQTERFEARIRLYQTTSATAVLLEDRFWKHIEVLPGQTVLDSTPIVFPGVNAETEFLIQWLAGTNRVLGTTEIRAYPTNLVAQLRGLAGDGMIGVLDPQNALGKLLQAQGIQFSDLRLIELSSFAGKLAIIGPFQSDVQMPGDLAKRIQTLAKKNVAVVWIQQPMNQRDDIHPSFYSIRLDKTAVVIAQSALVSNLFGNPQSQINLVSFCKLALDPQPPALPGLYLEQSTHSRP